MSFEVESEDVIRLILQFLKVLWQTQHAVETVLVSKLRVQRCYGVLVAGGRRRLVRVHTTQRNT